jgi:hypothetical protein
MIKRSHRRPEVAPPAPHPDPRIEAELQRITSLRKVIARREDLLDADHRQITDLRDTVSRHPTWDGTLGRRQQITGLLDETHALEAEIVKLHDEIAERIARLSDTDVAWLEPR